MEPQSPHTTSAYTLAQVRDTLPQTYTFAADALMDLAALMRDEGHGLSGPQMDYFDRLVALYRNLAMVQ